MSATSDDRVDVVIPVYNAPELVRRCIESLYKHVEHRIGRVIVHDNASGEETARMLDDLSHARLDVHHAAENTGFGSGVNQGVARASTPLVLVLNSDVEAHDDFVPPLIHALNAEPDMIAVSPSGSEFRGYDLSRYVMRSDCVISYNLWGYAFLMRRSLFQETGGFDEKFGLGYFEDVDLARRVVGGRGWFGIHSKSTVQHAEHGSFSDSSARATLLERNSHLYYARYPSARREVIVASGTSRLDELPQALRDEAEEILRLGGTVHWLAPSAPERLLALQMRGVRLGPKSLYRLLRKSRRRPHMRLSDLWLVDDLPRWKGALLGRIARPDGPKLRLWHTKQAAIDQPAVG